MTSRRDRHGRSARVDHDPRHRPPDGYRTASADRFTTLVHRAIPRLDEHHRTTVSGMTVRVVPVPPGRALATASEAPDAVPLARLVLDLNAAEGPTLEVYRRPLELRSTSRQDLEARLTHAIGQALDLAPGTGG